MEFADLDKDGKCVYWFGEHPRGYIVYDATGHMHIQIMKVPPLAPFPESNWDIGTPPSAEHAVAAYESYEAYFGTYTVDDAKNVVTHHVEGSVHPDYTDSEQPRPFRFNGDRLEIGDGKTYRRVLERVFETQAQSITETKSSAAHSERDRFVGVWQPVSITDGEALRWAPWNHAWCLSRRMLAACCSRAGCSRPTFGGPACGWLY